VFTKAMAPAKPSQGQAMFEWLWPGLVFSEAKATSSQAKASGFRAKPGQNITIGERYKG
jgi:hypothetical protein